MDETLLRSVARSIEAPAVLVDLAAFDRNVREVAHLVKSTGHGKTIRIATKSIRVPDLIRRVLSSDPIYQGLMCYSPREVLFLAEQGFDDLLLAYPSYSPTAIKDLVGLHRSGKRILLSTDSIQGIQTLSDRVGPVDHPVPVMIDLDASLRFFGGRIHIGVRRSPLHTVSDVLAAAQELSRHPNLSFAGLICYEAQVAGLGDRNPFKPLLNPIFHWIRKLSDHRVKEFRSAVSKAIQEAGFPVPVFNGGGSGSLNLSLEDEALTEVTAGSAFLCSHLFDYYTNIRFESAYAFALAVCRHPGPGTLTCSGGGYVSSGEPGWDKVPEPVFPSGMELISTEGCGEVQTPVRLNSAPSTPIPLDERILFRPAKAGEIAERFNEYALVHPDAQVQMAKTYRGLGQSFG